jgi:hypothetical protein
LLLDKLSDMYDPEQKKNKITNLISEMRIKGMIRNEGNKVKSKWVLAMA